MKKIKSLENLIKTKLGQKPLMKTNFEIFNLSQRFV